jgi:hypothetical protein
LEMKRSVGNHEDDGLESQLNVKIGITI